MRPALRFRKDRGNAEGMRPRSPRVVLPVGPARTMGLALLLVAAAAPGIARSADPTFRPLAAPAAPAAPVVTSVAAPIYNGQPTGSFTAVVAVLVLNGDDSTALCSGTLIAPTVVLTAGHCLSLAPKAAKVFVFPDGTTQVAYDAIRYSVHPDFTLSRLAVDDVSVLVLQTAVAGVSPQPLVSRRPRPGTRGTIVGFGDDAFGSVGVKRDGAVRLTRCPRAVRRVGIAPGQLSGSLCWRPKRRGQDTCQGDSGGPLLVRDAVAGVTSGGFPSCPGRLSWDTDVTSVRDWIDAALANAAQ